jgi:hypothetical protein
MEAGERNVAGLAKELHGYEMRSRRFEQIGLRPSMAFINRKKLRRDFSYASINLLCNCSVQRLWGRGSECGVAESLGKTKCQW